LPCFACGFSPALGGRLLFIFLIRGPVAGRIPYLIENNYRFNLYYLSAIKAWLAGMRRAGMAENQQIYRESIS
jgi:hypothetical protein